MSRSCLLYLTADGLRCFHRRNGEPVLERRFLADEGGVEEFAEMLATAPRGTQYSALIDVADEGFNVELVPAIHGRDRAAMLQRKLTQQFYGSPYAAYLALGRERQGRRDERVLFSALTRPAQLEPWITALVTAKVRVRGVHSAPFVLDRMMQRAKVPLPAYLLVNFTPAGVRQTYFSNGRLRFSRLSGGHDLEFSRQVEGSTEEIRKTLAYLSAQRLTRRGEPLPIVVLASPQHFATVRQCVALTGESAVTLIDVDRLRAAYGAPDVPCESPDSLPVLLEALGAEPQCTQIGGSEVLRYQRLHQVRRGLYLTAIGVLVAGGVIAGFGLFETQSLRRESLELARQIRLEEARYQALMKRFPELPAPADELRALMTDLDEMRDDGLAAVRLYQALGSALDQSPEVTLESLDWQRRVGGQGETKVLATARLRLAAQLSSDQRGQIEASERFTAELGRSIGGPVRLTRRPVDLGSTQTLRGNEGGNVDTPAPAPLFEVEFEVAAQGNAA